jgi:hypothetical protein
MANHRSRVIKLERRSTEHEFLVIVRRDGEMDEATWEQYLERAGLPTGTRIPTGRVVFVSEADALL